MWEHPKIHNCGAHSIAEPTYRLTAKGQTAAVFAIFMLFAPQLLYATSHRQGCVETQVSQMQPPDYRLIS